MERTERTPRPYQQELFEMARERNVIVCLPTGSGKTYISTMLIRSLKAEIIGDYNGNAKRTFFLVPTKALVVQQANELGSQLVENVMQLSGESYDENAKHIDKWDINVWNKYLCKNEIFVMTYQILLNALNHKFIPLNKINLIIFDEAHHAGEKKKNKKSSHPTTLIMEYINNSTCTEKPKVLGLTASLVKARVEVYELNRLVVVLEKIYNAKCVTIPKDRVNRTNPCEELWFFNAHENFWPTLTKNLEKMHEYFCAVKRENKTKCQEMSEEEEVENISYDQLLLRATIPIGFGKLSACFKNLASTLKDMGPHCFIFSITGYIDYLQRCYKNYEFSYKIYSDFMLSLINYLTNIREWVKQKIEFDEEKLRIDQLLRYATPRMTKLFNLLLNYNPSINDEVKLSAIIFVDKIVDAVILSNFLQKLAELDANSSLNRFSFIKADYLVGSTVMSGFSNNLIKYDPKRQNKILEDFRNGKLNVIVATSVLEEGLDVSLCNLVCRYNFPLNYRSWVQSKGRARSKQQPYFIILAPGLHGELLSINYFCKELQQFRLIEERLDQIAIDNQRGEVDNQIESEESELDTDFLLHPVTGAKITMKTAVNITTMYCHRLPNDAFSELRPYLKSYKNSVTGKFHFEVKMPVNSCFSKSIFGNEKKSAKRAKESAFLNVCKELYEMNKLDEHLVPIKQSKAIKSYCQELNLDYNPIDDLTLIEKENNKKSIAKNNIKNEKERNKYFSPGTRSRKQTYDQALSGILTDTVDLTFVLYSVNFPNDYESKIGLLINKQLPFNDPIKFFIFNRYGQVNIKLSLEKKVTLIGQQKELLEMFRLYFGKFIIKMKTNETKFNACLFTVLDENLNIDWKFIEKFIYECKQNEELSESESSFVSDENNPIKYRKVFEYNKNDYCDCVLATFHGDNVSSYFGTLNYHCDEQPNSPYKETSNERFTSYNDYYEKKYLLKIINQEQKLVRVFSLEHSHGSPTEVVLNKKISKYLTREKRLVPELTLRFSVKPSFWQKLMCLPSILFCINRKLIVKEFKNQIELDVFEVESTNETFEDENYEINFKENYNCEQKTALESENVIADNNKSLSVKHESVLNEIAQNRLVDDDVDDMILDSDEEADSSDDDLEIKQQIDGNIDSDGEDYDFTNNLRSESSIKRIEGNIRKINDSTNLFGKNDYDRLKLDTIQVEIIDDFNTNLCEHYESKIQSSVSILLDDKKKMNNNDKAELDFEMVENVTEPVARFNIRLLRCMHDRPGLPDINELIEAFTTKRFDELKNYERLETIGDSFLKFATSLFLFSTYSELNVGCLVLLKDKQVSNFNLYRLAKKTKIPELIFSEKFNSKNYMISKQHIIDDKCVADCVEALIGAYLMKSQMTAILFMHYIGLNVCQKNISLESENWLDEPKLPEICYTEEGQALIELFYQRQNLELLERKLNYRFKNKGFLVQALTHPSFYDNNITGSYQRLEFLGDAVLDFLITDYMFDLETKLEPGDMTHLRQSLVNNSFFGALTVKHDFDKYLMHFSFDLFNGVANFRKKFENVCSGELVLGAFVLINEFDTLLVEDIDIPKTLGDIFESIAAAVYLDSGRSLKEVWKAVYPLMKDELEHFRVNIPVSPIRLLHECFSEVKFSNCEIIGKKQHKITLTLKYTSYDENDGDRENDENRINEITFEAIGRTKKSAKITVAKKAIQALKLSKCKRKTFTVDREVEQLVKKLKT